VKNELVCQEVETEKRNLDEEEDDNDAGQKEERASVGAQY